MHVSCALWLICLPHSAALLLVDRHLQLLPSHSHLTCTRSPHTFLVMSEQLDLPLAPIHRIVKAAVPAGAGVSKDVKQALGKAASLFILYLTSTSVIAGRAHEKQTAALLNQLSSGGSLRCLQLGLTPLLVAAVCCLTRRRVQCDGCVQVSPSSDRQRRRRVGGARGD